MIILDARSFQYGESNFLCKEIAMLNTDSEFYLHRFVKISINISHYLINIGHIKYVARNMHDIEWENDNN